jgi:hypothetical protein
MNIDEVALTKLLVYGTTSPGADPNTHIRPDNASAPSVTYSMNGYMTTGAGRYAKPSSAPLIEAFFADSESANPVLTPGMSYSVGNLQAVLGIAGGLQFNVSNYTTGGTSSDFVERAYVFGGSWFELTSAMTFNVDSNGVYTVSNIEVIAREDDFDFQSNNWLAGIANAQLELALDPYGLIPEVGGNTTGVRILWDNSGGATYAIYTQANFDSDTEFVEDATGAVSAAAALGQLTLAEAGLLTGLGYLGTINSDQYFRYYTSDGKKVVYGTNDDDAITPLSAELTVDVYFDYQMVGGAGNDSITGSSVFSDELWGGEGDDELKGEGGDDILQGGAGNDVAVFRGECLAYDIARNGDGSITVSHVRDLFDIDGTDTLFDVEIARFSDGKELDLTASEIHGCTELGFVQDFVTGTTQDTQVVFDLEREGDTSYDVEVFVDGRVTTGNAVFNDFYYTLPAGENPQLIITASVAEAFGDVAFDFEIDIDVVSPLNQLVMFSDATAGGVLIGDEVDDQGGWFWGDPHLITFDNVAYDFQAEGEFVLARATAGEPYELQARFKALSSAVSVATAMATRIDTNVVSIEIDGGDGILRIDGIETALDDGQQLSVGSGAISRAGRSVVVDHGNGDQTEVAVFASFLNATPKPAGTRDAGSFEGLLGNDNGTPADDFRLADGSVLVTPISTETLYGDFAESWTVTAAERMLPGDATDYDAPDRIVTIDSLPATLRAEAEAVVDGFAIDNELIREAAILDFALTGNTEFIEAAALSDENFNPIVGTVPVDPVVNPVVVLTTDTTTLVEEDAEARVATLTVSRGSTDGDLTVHYSLTGNGASPASDQDFVGGSVADSVVIADGEEAATFQVEVVI